MQKFIYKGVEYDIKIVNGKVVAVYLNGELVESPLAEEIADDYETKHPTPKRPRPY